VPHFWPSISFGAIIILLPN